jgi:hypothetical protein
LVAFMGCACAISPLARAQAPTPPTPPTTAVVQADVRDESLGSLGRAITRVVSARGEALGAIELSGTPALGLEDLQLALGCIGETTECLGAVARQLEVDALLVPALERTEGTVVVSILYFDGRTGEGRARRGARRVSAEAGDDEALAAVDPILRELFELGDAPAGDGLDLETGGEGTGTGSNGGVTSDNSELPVVPIVVAGAGAAIVAAGVVFGVLSMNSQSEFASTMVDGTEGSVDAALAAHDRAVWQAVTADVLFGVGAAAIATGVVLFIVDLMGGESEPEVAITPHVGPDRAGVALSGRFATW